ncbi:MAG: hypothetical protein WBA54_12755, partial [Acidaminobacteraceae bacterium]
MTEQFYEKSLDFQIFNEGSFVIDFKSKEMFLSDELSKILLNDARKTYLMKEFFEKFVVFNKYEEFIENVESKLEKFDRNIFFENIRIKDNSDKIHNFTVKGRFYGENDNLKIVGEIFE